MLPFDYNVNQRSWSIFYQGNFICFFEPKKSSLDKKFKKNLHDYI